MTGPRRVQVTGDLFHGRVPDGAVYVGRQAPGLKRSRFANPFSVKGRDHAEAVRLYREHLAAHPGLAAAARAELAGRDLACWCKLPEACHADVLLATANGEGAITVTTREALDLLDTLPDSSMSLIAWWRDGNGDLARPCTREEIREGILGGSLGLDSVALAARLAGDQAAARRRQIHAV